METYLLISLAIAPSLFLLLYFYSKDRYEPEPLSKIILVFSFGAISVLPALLIEMVLEAPYHETEEFTLLIYNSFLVIAGSEELAKFLAVYFGAYRSIEFDEPMDGIVYCVSASLGFATVENILYVLKGGVVVGLVRAFTSVPGHALFSGIMGYYVGLSKFDLFNRGKLLVKGVIAAVFLHGTWDFFLFLSPASLIFVLIPLLLFMGIKVKGMIKEAEKLSRYRETS